MRKLIGGVVAALLLSGCRLTLEPTFGNGQCGGNHSQHGSSCASDTQ